MDESLKRALLAVAFAVVLAGCAAPVADDSLGHDGLGQVENVTYAEELSIENEQQLTEGELEKLTKRTMARIEVVRGLEFEHAVEVDVISREEYQQNYTGGAAGADADWENLRWEALFVIGQDRDATEVLDEAFGEAVRGFYSPGAERIVIVSDGEHTTINKGTLIHELVHALQDQQFGLGHDARTVDERLAREGVIEGEAELVPELYLNRCGVTWSCVTPELDAEAARDVHPGVYMLLIQPYLSGPEFVDEHRQRGGWRAVDALHDDLPVSSQQIIHPEKYPDERPVNVTVPDRSDERWERLDREPELDTFGEASLFVMLAHNDIITVEDPSTYRHTFTEGWAGDAFATYEHGDDLGYVWTLHFESADDRQQFHRAYEDLLEEHGGTERGGDVVVISDGPFEGAFEVTGDDERLRIVKGPDVDALDAIHDS